MNKKVLITGISGFAGRHMAAYLQALDPASAIIGVDLQRQEDCPCDRFYGIDLSDANGVQDLFKRESPDYVIHLAGVFGTDNVSLTYRINVLSAVALLESIRQFAPEAIFITAGSAAEYGRVESCDMPITEAAPCNPVTPYGQSKYLATSTAQYYFRVHNLCTMVVRPFQLIGKGVTDRLAPGAFAKRLTDAVQAGKKEILVGNLESSRDFLDIHDAVRAIWMLCENPKPGDVFNLCSGTPVKMQALFDLMTEVIGTPIQPVTESTYLRGKADVNVVYGSYKKLKSHCGWVPLIKLDESVSTMVDFEKP